MLNSKQSAVLESVVYHLYNELPCGPGIDEQLEIMIHLMLRRPGLKEVAYTSEFIKSESPIKVCVPGYLLFLKHTHLDKDEEVDFETFVKICIRLMKTSWPNVLDVLFPHLFIIGLYAASSKLTEDELLNLVDWGSYTEEEMNAICEYFHAN